jgi:hypothetical protein
MPCCGQKRQQLRGTNAPRPVPGQPAGPGQPAQPATFYFEYVGRTGLTVIGPITGRRYRFDRTGARVTVDGRDAPSLAAVPQLEQVSHL